MSAALIRRFRGLAIAFVVLALSAGAAFAAAPALNLAGGPSAGTSAEEPEANEEPDGQEAEDPGDDAQDEDADEDAEEAEAPENEDGAAKEGTHGELVSTAAQMGTPEGFANHGAFVSCVAHMKDVALADVDWTTVTPEACAEAKEAAKAKRDAAKAERAAARAAAKEQRGLAKAAREAARAERKAAGGN